jgi:carbon storage regulator
MLVLSRQRDESIIIGDNIVVTIVDIRGDKVRLGINAPSEIPVHRQEIYEAIQRENLRSSRVEPKDPARSAPPACAPGGPAPIARGDSPSALSWAAAEIGGAPAR